MVYPRGGEDGLIFGMKRDGFVGAEIKRVVLPKTKRVPGIELMSSSTRAVVEVASQKSHIWVSLAERLLVYDVEDVVQG
jgi:hypothetical protein